MFFPAIETHTCIANGNPYKTMSCSDVVNALIPCGSYFLGASEANLNSECCSSAQALNKMVGTVKSVCTLRECLKTSGPSFGVVPARAKYLPPFCKLKLSIPDSPTLNCDRQIQACFHLIKLSNGDLYIVDPTTVEHMMKTSFYKYTKKVEGDVLSFSVAFVAQQK